MIGRWIFRKYLAVLVWLDDRLDAARRNEREQWRENLKRWEQHNG